MDVDLEQRLVKYMDKLEAMAQSGADFAADQIPLVLQEYVTYYRITNAVQLGIFLVAFLLSISLFRWGFRNLCEDTEHTRPELIIPPLIFGAVAIMVFGAAFFSSVEPCIKAWAAPRVLLLDKLNEMRK